MLRLYSKKVHGGHRGPGKIIVLAENDEAAYQLMVAELEQLTQHRVSRGVGLLPHPFELTLDGPLNDLGPADVPRVIYSADGDLGAHL